MTRLKEKGTSAILQCSLASLYLRDDDPALKRSQLAFPMESALNAQVAEQPNVII